MYRKTKCKIVLSIMIVLAVFLGITFGVIYISSYLSMIQQNEQILEHYVTLYSLENLPGKAESELNLTVVPEDAPKDAPDGILGFDLGKPKEDAGKMFRLSSFYSVSLDKDGGVIATDTGRGEMYTESEVQGIAEQILEKKKNSGLMGHLLYRVEQRTDYTLVAFLDITVTKNSMSTLLINILLAGIFAAFVLYFLAARLARVIVKPLEEDDIKQKQFISDAGHELKTPITVIGTNAELLSREIGENNWLSNIRYENERMGKLVRELLELSRAEQEHAEPELINLSTLVEREVLPFEGVAYEHGKRIVSEISDGVLVYGNSRQLGQLVAILMDNAIEHSREGSEISVSLTAERRLAKIRVTNDGEIPEEQQAHIFDRFYRLDEARNDTGSHYGLGLSIAKAFATTHKGDITVTCAEGKVTMLVTLPMVI